MMQQKPRRNIWEFFLNNRRFTSMIAVAITLIGLISMIQIPKESNPEVNVPFAVVSAPFPGASADDVEELVVDVLEDKILGMDSIANVTSTSREGVGVISVEFDAGGDTDKLVDELKEKVDEAELDLPEEAENVFVQKVNFNDEAIYTFAISGPFPLPQLKQFAETLKDDIEPIAGVSGVDILGGQEREVQVLVDKAKLDSLGVEINQVSSAIRRANADIPSGSIETSNSRYTLRLSGRIFTADEVSLVPVAARGGAVIRVGDVATVVDGLNDATSISRLSVDGSESLPAINMEVKKAAGGNILRIVKQVKQVLNNSKEVLPEDLTTATIIDMAEFIEEDISSLSINGLQTVALVMIILFFFIGWREALIAGLAIPLTFLMTFAFMVGMGSTINFLSLFSLILSLGILIDSAIVVVEGIHSNMRKGLTPLDAACKTINDFKLPLIVGTLTTVFAFLPMLLMSGILGEFVKHIPITVTIVLMSSLFVGLGIVPTLTQRILGSKKSEKFLRLTNLLERKSVSDSEGFTKFNKKYRNILRGLLNDKKKRRKFTWSLVGLFVASFLLPGLGILKVVMFPPTNQDFMFVEVENPIGTPLEETARTIEPIEEVLAADTRIKSFVGNAGAGGSHLASFTINLKKDRKDRSESIIDDIQSLFNTDQRLNNTDVTVSQATDGPPSGAPFEIKLKGGTLTELESTASDIKNMVETIPGTRSVRSSVAESTGEFKLEIDRDKAQLFGISTIEVASVLRNAISGSEATVLRKDGEEIDVIVKYALDPSIQPGERSNVVNLEAIESLTINTPSGDIPLSSFTSSRLSGGRPNIRHEDGERIVTVTSLLGEGIVAADIFAIAEGRLDEISIPDDVNVVTGGESADLDESVNDMFRAMIFAVFLIGGILVFQFNSFRQPLYILITIPLALIGVFSGLVLVGFPMSFPAIIGVVALAGIVVNNAIILVDRMNVNRAEGMDLETAIVEATRSRIRPILITTITTVAGMLPITLSNELWGPLGWAIIFGLSFSSITTLFVVPLLYNRGMKKELKKETRA